MIDEFEVGQTVAWHMPDLAYGVVLSANPSQDEYLIASILPHGVFEIGLHIGDLRLKEADIPTGVARQLRAAWDDLTDVVHDVLFEGDPPSD